MSHPNELVKQRPTVLTFISRKQQQQEFKNRSLRLLAAAAP
jgi:hypothetical protein